MKINNLTGKPLTGVYQDRCTGKSTALALKYIADAIENPNKRIVVKDHYGTQEADRYLLRKAQEVVEMLDLKEIKFNTVNNTILFNLYSDVDEYIEVNGQLYKKVETWK